MRGLHTDHMYISDLFDFMIILPFVSSACASDGNFVARFAKLTVAVRVSLVERGNTMLPRFLTAGNQLY